MVLDSAIATTALLRREMLTSMRQGRTWALVTFSVLLTFGVTAFALATMGEGGLNVIEAQQLFALFTMLLFGAAVLLVPLYASTLICQEKQENTYDALLSALIPPWGVVLGKTLSALGFYFFIIVATMPLLGVFFFFAGIDQIQFQQAFAILILTALASGAIGVACSARFYRSAAAIVTTVFSVAAFHGLVILALFVAVEFAVDLYPEFADIVLNRAPGAPRGVVFQSFEFLSRTFENSAAIWSPGYALFEVIDGSLLSSRFLGGLLYQAAAIILAYLVALRFLRRPAKPIKVSGERPIDDQQLLRDRRKKFPYYLVDPLRRTAAIPDGRNPMYYKELLSGFVGGKDTRIRLFYVYFAIGMAATAIPFATVFNDPAFSASMAMMIQTAAILFAVPVVVATVFTKEFESGGLDMLRMTMLRTAPVVAGKLFAVAVTITPMLIAMVLLNAPLLFFSLNTPMMPFILLGGLLSMLVTVAYATGICAVATLFTRRMGAAIVSGYVACALFIGGLPAFATFVGLRLSANPNSEYDILAPIIAAMSPLTAQYFHTLNIVNHGMGVTGTFYQVFLLFAYGRFAWVLNRVALGLFAREGMQERIQT